MYGTDLAWIHHVGFGGFAREAAPGIIAALRRRGIDRGLVVDAGCGSGILARALTDAGYDVLGIDVSPAMIALARATAAEAAFRVESLDDAELPPCAAIVAAGEVLNYVDIRRFIPRAAAALRPGGVLLFDVAEDARPGELRIGGEDWSVIAIKTGEGRRLTRRILTFREAGGEVRRGEETHTIELYDRAAVETICSEAGFHVTRRRSYGARRLPKGCAVYLCVRR